MVGNAHLPINAVERCHLAPRGSFIPRALLVLALFLAAAASTAQARQPTAIENAYVALAWDTKSTIPCEAISPDAVEAGELSPPGYQVFYTRSRCYLGVAINSRDADVCANVKQVKTGELDGSAYSESGCRQRVSTQAGNEKTWIPGAIIPVLLNALGITTEILAGHCDELVAKRRATAPAFGDQHRLCDGASCRDATRKRAATHYFGPLDNRISKNRFWYCGNFFDWHCSEPERVSLSVTSLEEMGDPHDLYLSLLNSGELAGRLNYLR